MDGYVNGWAHVKSLNQINLDLIEKIQLWTFWTFLDILLKPPQPLMGLFFFVSEEKVRTELSRRAVRTGYGARCVLPPS